MALRNGTVTLAVPDLEAARPGFNLGHTHRRGDAGYEALRWGVNIVLEHHPEAIIDATSDNDIIAAVELANRDGRPLAVMNTGHGPTVPADGAVLIRTARMNRVEVDPVRRTARIEAGVAWQQVIDAASRWGLAPLNGSSPHVGAVGYTIGGGVGLLARRFGFAADHVRWINAVTADGRLRHVTANADLDLFWALRGAGANFGVVTAMEVDLFPVASLLGGGLYFGAGESEEVVHAYVDWARDVPETMASSILLIGYPDLPEVPAALRGQHVTHVRIAYSGNDRVVGYRLVERLRGIGPRLLDTVRVMPYAEVGSIHDEATDEPVAAYDRNVLLRDLDHDAATVLSRHAGPAAKPRFIAELRAWGGALSRPAAIPNAVGSRDTAYSLLAISEPAQESRSSRDQMLAAMHPWRTGRTYLNFAGVEDTALDSVRRAYSAEDFARLQELKASYDPRNMFRINFNIPPTSPSVRVALTRKGR